MGPGAGPPQMNPPLAPCAREPLPIPAPAFWSSDAAVEQGDLIESGGVVIIDMSTSSFCDMLRVGARCAAVIHASSSSLNALLL